MTIEELVIVMLVIAFFILIYLNGKYKKYFTEQNNNFNNKFETIVKNIQIFETLVKDIKTLHNIKTDDDELLDYEIPAEIDFDEQPNNVILQQPIQTEQKIEQKVYNIKTNPFKLDENELDLLKPSSYKPLEQEPAYKKISQIQLPENYAKFEQGTYKLKTEYKEKIL